MVVKFMCEFLLLLTTNMLCYKLCYHVLILIEL